MLTAGVTEAFGLVLIIPLLQAVGLNNAGAESNSVVESVVQIAESLGVGLTLHSVLVVFLVLAAIRSSVSWYRAILSTRLQLEFKDSVREQLYSAVARASWGHLINRRRSDIQYMLTDNIGRVGHAAFVLLQLLAGSILATAQFAIALMVSLEVAIVALALGLGLIITSRPMLKRSHSLGEKLTGSGRVLRGYVTDFLDGLKPAKTQNAETVHVQRFQRQIAQVREKQVSFTSLSAGTHAALQFTAAISLTGLVWYTVVSASLTLPELALIAIVFARVIPNILKLLQQVQILINALPAYVELTKMRGELQAEAESIEQCESTIAIENEIQMQDIEFVYPRGSERALTQISLHIPAKKIFSITGPSGSGKTTLADLLLGLLEPTHGSMFVDGVKLTNVDIRRWRRGAAYVAQEPFLLHESIRSNLLWAQPKATVAEMQAALRFASAEFVNTLEKGLDTLVGDRGSRLSGGERQRVVLAAALLRNPELLVLDEPTGQLDSYNENRVIETLCRLRGRTTVIVITHSASLLREADYVVTLNSGRTVSYGPWQHTILPGRGKDKEQAGKNNE